MVELVLPPYISAADIFKAKGRFTTLRGLQTEKFQHEGYHGATDRQFIDIQILPCLILSLYIILKTRSSENPHLFSDQVALYPSEGTGIASGTTVGILLLPGVDSAFLPLGVEGAVATAVKVGSLATSCAKTRMFGTCNPTISDVVQRKGIHDGTYVSNCSSGRGSGISYSPESSSGTASRSSFSFPPSAITRPATAF